MFQKTQAFNFILNKISFVSMNKINQVISVPVLILPNYLLGIDDKEVFVFQSLVYTFFYPLHPGNMSIYCFTFCMVNNKQNVSFECHSNDNAVNLKATKSISFLLCNRAIGVHLRLSAT